MTKKDYDLNRFLKAQELMYPWALREMKNGKKQSHWMWFIFPQLKALGRSSTAIYYGIEDIGEARAYIEHPILGARLREISQALLELDTNDALAVMGHPDNLKLCSCMTLFSRAAQDDRVFEAVINKFFNGNADAYTQELLDKASGDCE